MKRSRISVLLGAWRVVVFLMLASGYIVSAFAQHQWERTYGGAGNDYGYSVQQTADGGYIVAGYTDSFGDSNQVYLIKTDAAGDILWTRRFGRDGNDYGYAVQQTTDGGYIIAGTTNSYGNSSQVYLIKTNANGDTIWTRTYGGTLSDYGRSVRQTTDGGYIIAGTYRSSLDQVYLIKTNTTGDTLWTRAYGVHSSSARSVLQTSDTGYIVTGVHGFAYLLMKTNSSGDTIWFRTYGYSPFGGKYSNSVKQTSDGGYIVVGGNSFMASVAVLIKTDAYGDTSWIKWYDSRTGHDVLQTPDDGFIITGSTAGVGYGQVYLLKTASNGDTVWCCNYGTANDHEGGCAVQRTTDGGYIIAGSTEVWGSPQLSDVYLIKTDSLGNSTGVEEKNNAVQKIHYGATIFSGPLRLPEGKKCRVFDITGRVVEPANITRGIYFIEIDNRIVHKVVKVR